MSLIAEFSLRSSELALSAALDAAPDVTVELEQQMATEFDVPVMMLWAFGGDFGRLETGLERDESVRESAAIEALGDRKLYRIRLDPDNLCPIYPLYQRLGASPMAATGSADGWERRVRFPDRDSVVEMRRRCAERDVTFRLRRLYTPGDGELEDEFGLSAEQRDALTTAERVGYFEVPREVALEELGEELGVSGQSASERIRRGISKLVSNTLLSDF
ncbi:helix-turn-helix domain-containing protein [Halorussus limi]|uniref:Helix-turn-helix domain-containing protein n=1 Tax=Halorussus limi TaxID=2938695 RepID=A0A8U0HXF5_9EURY|nr:helix-turn-helix domain-containing protein [Halorussus limi]UPV75453.1 helix-turn-helix domain-containing protein [Halorussus limi]